MASLSNSKLSLKVENETELIKRGKEKKEGKLTCFSPSAVSSIHNSRHTLVNSTGTPPSSHVTIVFIIVIVNIIVIIVFVIIVIVQSD